MRKKAGFKQYVFLGLIGATLVSVACGDDDDDASFSNAGTSGSGGSSSGGKGGSGGKSSAGANTGGKSNTAGTSATAGKGGESTAGTAGTDSTGGTTTAGTGGTTSVGGDRGDAGEPGVGGEPGGGAGGEPGAGGAAGMAGMSGAGGEGGGPEAVVFDTLENPSFDVGTANNVPTGWTNEGTTGAAFYEAGSSHGGPAHLGQTVAYDAANPTYTARTYQTIDPIENGTYSFSIWVSRGDTKTPSYLFAKGFDAADADHQVTQDTAANAYTYTKVTLSGIVVTSGHVTVGVYTENWGGNWVGWDDAEFVKE